MGGQVYETLSVQFLNKGKSEGQKMEKLSIIDKLVASGVCSFEKACEVAEITPAKYEKLKKQFSLSQEANR